MEPPPAPRIALYSTDEQLLRWAVGTAAFSRLLTIALVAHPAS